MVRKNKISQKEAVWYVIAGILILASIAFFIVSLIGNNLDVLASKNPILNAEKSMNSFFGFTLNFLGLGLICLGVGVIVALIALTVFAKSEDREQERELRHKQRVQFVDSDVVEVPSTPVEEEASKEQTNE